jgi:hypothetical protein
MPSKYRGLALVQEAIRKESWANYSELLSGLFVTHVQFEEVQKLSGLFRSKRYDLFLEYADLLSQQQYGDITKHYVMNQLAMLIRKYPWDPKVVKTDPETKAIKSFLASERRCFLLNRKFDLYAKLRRPYEPMLQKMRQFIEYVLGEEPQISQVVAGMAFGSGASVGVHGNATNLRRKLSVDKFSCTPGALTLAYRGFSHDPFLKDFIFETRNRVSCIDHSSAKARMMGLCKFVSYNKISFVPKTAKTHRAIAVEPLLNGFVQKGIDTLLRKKLKRVGIDLSDQSKNQELARLGSVDDSDQSFCTIDLTSASDNISINVVRQILPEAWFRLLDDSRSKEFLLNGVVKRYEKFCSMGNGFCFPLETLIFVAVCVACGAGVPGTDFSVYGDDIIVRRKVAEDVLKGLKALGFIPNRRKTFVEGPFRESCGADWFAGVDVRPYILDEKLDSLQALFKFLNLSRRNRLANDFFTESRELILSKIPKRFQFWRPFSGPSDSGITAWADQHLTARNCRYRGGIWKVEQLATRPREDNSLWREGIPRSSAEMYALLAGTIPNRDGTLRFTVRRKTSTSIRFTACSGATSTLLPDTGLFALVGTFYLPR